ncbi:hypothetical protein P0136_04480 [Lentisphaerota bacterium ZTH]|nr:hypothetical protein JYG24_04400 [Lentisphaerota bacterium]WET07251.1 hypothetical protein P0136_04480 [Lentisphaerota bacterium ZTH]
MSADTLTLSLIILAYLSIIACFSLHGFRNTRNTKDYLLAGRSTHSSDMSTLSSLFHVTSNSTGHDFFCSVFKRHNDSITITRSGIIFSIIVSIMLGYPPPPGIAARETAMFFGVCAATYLLSYAAAIYWEGTTFRACVCCSKPVY